LSLVLLDSCVVIDVLRRSAHALKRIEVLVEEGYELATCSVVITEIYAGMRHSEKSTTDDFMNCLTFLDASRNTAVQAGTMIAHYRRAGVTLHLPDATIASIAQHWQAALLTHNQRDFPLAKLKFIEWA
jgi:predicted nucleic acid-binding protein